MGQRAHRVARGLVGLVTAAWVASASLVGFLVLELGSCAADWDDPRPRGPGADAVCSGDFPFVPALLTFLVTGFVGLAVLVQRWGAGWRHTLLLCGGVALLPFVTYAALRVLVTLG